MRRGQGELRPRPSVVEMAGGAAASRDPLSLVGNFDESTEATGCTSETSGHSSF
jgi:hypothetical protein